MWAMSVSANPVEVYCNSGPGALLDLSTTGQKQRLYLVPPYTRQSWADEDSLQCHAVSVSHINRISYCDIVVSKIHSEVA